MEQDKELPSKNVRSTAKWHISEQTIQRVAARRKETGIIVSPNTIRHAKSTAGTARVITVDRRIWKKARLIAEKVARTTLALSSPAFAAIDDNKVRNLAIKLIVINNDGSVVIYNNPEQANRAKHLPGS